MEEEDKESSMQSSEVGAGGGDNSVSAYKFRNYTPQTHFLDGLYTVEKSEPATISQFIQDKLDLISSDDTGFRIDPKLFEPKKVDWDLKRRIERRMEILERNTNKKIKELRKKR